MEPCDRRVLSVERDGVSQARLSRSWFRRGSQTERDTSGVRAWEMLENAEGKVFDAVVAYLNRGASIDLVYRIVSKAVSHWLIENYFGKKEGK
jgi:hypothetical protein